MMVTKSDTVTPRSRAIPFNAFQNASSRLTLVLWLARTIDRLLTVDFIGVPLGAGDLRCHSYLAADNKR